MEPNHTQYSMAEAAAILKFYKKLQCRYFLNIHLSIIHLVLSEFFVTRIYPGAIQNLLSRGFITTTHPKIISSRPSCSENRFQLSCFISVKVGNVSTIVTELLFLTTELIQWNAERMRCTRITSDTKKGKGSSRRVRRKKREKRKIKLNVELSDWVLLQK